MCGCRGFVCLICLLGRKCRRCRPLSAVRADCRRDRCYKDCHKIAQSMVVLSEWYRRRHNTAKLLFVFPNLSFKGAGRRVRPGTSR